MDINVVWVHRYGPQMASFRYRAATPAVEVGKLNGFRTALNNGEADIVIFSKPTVDDVPVAEKAKKDGAKVIVDLADDHFSDGNRELYLRFAALADGIVTGTNVMRGRIYDHTKKDSVAIPDPYEFPECEPHADGDDYLWFGHVSNYKDVISILPSMGTRKLRVVTGQKPVSAPSSEIPWMGGMKSRVVSGPTHIAGTIPWTPENMTAAFGMSNIVILPTRLGSEFKTPNRLLNSIRAGCFCVCMGHPAYREFNHYVWVGNFPTGLRWAEHFRKDLNGLVKSAQDYIRDRYSPEAIGKMWASYLESV